MENATGEAQDKETGLAISKDTEDTIEKEGFCFKETVMSGDPLEKSGKQEKALGLRRDIEKEKIKGVYAEEDTNLKYLEAILSQKITRWILLLMAQSQFDTLGLLNATVGIIGIFCTTCIICHCIPAYKKMKTLFQFLK